MSFRESLAFGRVGEQQVAAWLVERQGRTVLPVGDKHAMPYRGPRITGPEREEISPDILVVHEGELSWIEVKRKTRFSWHGISLAWVTGIDIEVYEQYQAVQERFSWPVWLLFLQEQSTPSHEDLNSRGCPESCPTGLFGGVLSELSKHENHRSDQYGRSGMVYWEHETLMQLASLEDVRAAEKERRQRIAERTKNMLMPF